MYMLCPTLSSAKLSTLFMTKQVPFEMHRGGLATFWSSPPPINHFVCLLLYIANSMYLLWMLCLHCQSSTEPITLRTLLCPPPHIYTSQQSTADIRDGVCDNRGHQSSEVLVTQERLLGSRAALNAHRVFFLLWNAADSLLNPPNLVRGLVQARTKPHPTLFSRLYIASMTTSVARFNPLLSWCCADWFKLGETGTITTMWVHEFWEGRVNILVTRK